jgi:hypothetical protein
VIFRLALIGLIALAVQIEAHAAFTEQGATILGGANFTSRSASLADIDNDGDLDLMFETSASTNGVQLFKNNLITTSGTPSFTFTNVTSTMMPASLADRPGASWSAAWGDYDNDGWIDVFVGQSNSGTTGDVLHNNGGTGFTNTSNSVGLNDPGFHQNVAWADINSDRRLDLLIGMEGPERHAIYLQDANGFFTNVGAEAGFQVDYGTKSYGMAIGDSDGDGDLDVYISTCKAGGAIRNNFFKNMLNETGSLTFVDIADTNGTQLLYNTYGSEFVDFDNDGDLDLLVTGAQNDGTGTGERTKIFRNNGGNMFTDVDTLRGGLPLLGNQGTDLNGAKVIDYDNDGDLDLYFHDNLGATSNQRLYRNEGNWQFIDVTNTTGIGTNTGAGGYDSTVGDLDRDGDLDIVNPNNSTLGGTPTPERVYVNDASTNGNHWLVVDLKGPPDNTTGIGSSVYATLNEGTPQEVTLRREANAGSGTFNQSDVPVHIGLGSAADVDMLRIVWPDGTKQSIAHVNADQYLTVQYMPGEFNGDGIVDAADFVTWRNGLGTIYNAKDYNSWKAHLGETTGTGGATGASGVPEPCILGLVVVGVGVILPIMRRR